MKKEYFDRLLRSIVHCGIQSERIEECLTDIIDLANKNGDKDIADLVYKYKNDNHRVFYYETRKSDQWGGYEFMYHIQKPVENLVVDDKLEKQICSLCRAINKNAGINKILFTGKAGTGKTAMVNYLANALNLECYVINCINLVDSHLGQTPKNVIKVFDTIRHCDKKTIYFFDEIDSIVNNRTNFKDLEEMARVVTATMRGFDSLDGSENAIVIAATNLDKNLDPAFLRRFDKTINFDIYTNNLRSLIALKYFLEYDKEKKYDIIEFKNYFDELFSANIGALSPANIKNAIKAAFAFIEDDASVEDMKSLISQELHERAEPC